MKVEIEDGRLIVTPITEEDSRIIMHWRPPMPHSMRFAIRSWAKQFVAPMTLSQTFS